MGINEVAAVQRLIILEVVQDYGTRQAALQRNFYRNRGRYPELDGDTRG